MPANEMNPVEEGVSLSHRNLDPAKTPELTEEILTEFLYDQRKSTRAR